MHFHFWLSARQLVEVTPICGMKLDKWHLWLNLNHVTFNPLHADAANNAINANFSLLLILLFYTLCHADKIANNIHFKMCVSGVIQYVSQLHCTCMCLGAWGHNVHALEYVFLTFNEAKYFLPIVMTYAVLNVKADSVKDSVCCHRPHIKVLLMWYRGVEGLVCICNFLWQDEAFYSFEALRVKPVEGRGRNKSSQYILSLLYPFLLTLR